MSNSICIASHNGERFIKKQLESILSQIDPKDEIIISDDSSTDNTLEIIKSFNDRRITLLENNKFYDPVFNIENALKHAQGEYIFLADQDDIWMKDKVSICIEYLKKYDLVLSDCSIIDENDNTIEPSFFQLRHSKPGFIKNFYLNSYIGCCMAFNRKILNKVLPFPPDIAMHDMWIGLTAELTGKTYFIKQKLVHYRRHSENLSSTSQFSKYSINYRINYRIRLLHRLLQRVLF